MAVGVSAFQENRGRHHLDNDRVWREWGRRYHVAALLSQSSFICFLLPQKWLHVRFGGYRVQPHFNISFGVFPAASLGRAPHFLLPCNYSVFRLLKSNSSNNSRKSMAVWPCWHVASRWWYIHISTLWAGQLMKHLDDDH